MTTPTDAPEGVNAAALPTLKAATLPEAIPIMPADPEAIGPNAVAVAAFWEGYMGMDGLVMDWFDDGDDNRLEARFAALAEEFRIAVTTAGPPVSVMDALALASLQHELLSDAANSKPYTVFGARGVALKAIADQLAQLVPVG
ncbi:MAG: hypothetical protein OJK14_02910 [Achromobacter sp.]|uniref:hypothetical protein n=1 Tax=Achromobacter sp. TaxID=134375 RepID=UPI0025885760|nr:hypothetical protein [Achromobacter sp.]MCW0206019.1 hypothetical protein [Achromobacter sp.]